MILSEVWLCYFSSSNKFPATQIHFYYNLLFLRLWGWNQYLMHVRQVDIPSFPDTRWILKCKHVISIDICSFRNLFLLLVDGKCDGNIHTSCGVVIPPVLLEAVKVRSAAWCFAFSPRTHHPPLSWLWLYWGICSDMRPSFLRCSGTSPPTTFLGFLLPCWASDQRWDFFRLFELKNVMGTA